MSLLLLSLLCVVLYRERNGSTIYVNNFPTVLFLVKEIAKLERERFVFCPRLFREGGGPRDDQAEVREKEPLTAQALFGEKSRRKFKMKKKRSKTILDPSWSDLGSFWGAILGEETPETVYFKRFREQSLFRR